MIKPGTIGFVQLENRWRKAIVVAGRQSKLGIRMAPRLTEKIIHVDEFLSEDKVRLLNGGEVKYRYEVRFVDILRNKFDYWKRVFKSNRRRKMVSTLNNSFRIGTMGWARIAETHSKLFRTKWARCLVIEKQEKNLLICFAPQLDITTVPVEHFIAERTIEHGLEKLGLINRFRLKVELRASRVPYKADHRTIVKFDNQRENE